MFTFLDQKNAIENRKWKKSSPIAERRPQFRKYLPDDQYLANMRFREPAFRYIIENFKVLPLDPLSYMRYPILLLGFWATPMAIELSQWGYPTTLIIRGDDELERVKANCEKHAGNLREILNYNYYAGVPSSRIIVWIDDDVSIPEERIPEWIEYLKTRCQFLILAVRGRRNSEEVVKKLKNVTINRRYGDYDLIISY